MKCMRDCNYHWQRTSTFHTQCNELMAKKRFRNSSQLLKSVKKVTTYYKNLHSNLSNERNKFFIIRLLTDTRNVCLARFSIENIENQIAYKN